MRKKNKFEVRTRRKDVLVGVKWLDKQTGTPVLKVKGKGENYDTITLQEVAEALYGEGVQLEIKIA